MSIKVTTEPKEHRQLGLIIEVDDDRFEKEMRKAARKAANQHKIPGFRKGRAPYNVIVHHFGVGALAEQFVDELGREMYKAALEQEDIKPYGGGAIDSIEMEPLRYHVTVPLAPEVKLGDYRSLRVEEPPVEVDENEVQARIDQILERKSAYGEVERPSEYGDLMNVDVKAVVLDAEGNETDTVVLDENDWDITPDGDNPMEPAGFDAALLGMVPGDEKTFEIDWPQESVSMYAGSRVRFHVVLHSTQAYIRPELTDEVAQSVGPDFETAADLVAHVRESLRDEAANGAKNEFLTTILDQLVEMSEIDYPPIAIEMQIDQMLRTMDTRFRQMGIKGVDDYLEITNQTREDYREEQREEAEKLLRHNLVLSEIALAEKVTVSDEDIEQYVIETFGALDENATEEEIKARQHLIETMRDGPNRTSSVERIMTDKTFALIQAIARGEEIPEPIVDEADGQDTVVVAESGDDVAAQDEAVAENVDAEPVTAVEG